MQSTISFQGILSSCGANNLARKEALELLHQDTDALLASATALRERTFGSRVQMCAIINARSGQCGMDCAFCSQSGHHHANVPVFALLSPAMIRARLDALAHAPLHRVGIVTSGGRLSREEVAQLADVVAHLPSCWEGRVCASLGRLERDDLDLLRASGLTRFHHNLESNESYYAAVCSTQSWQDRLATVHRARGAGLQVCSGGLFGLGESWEDRVDFALSLRREGIVEVPINFLHPHSGTPLASQPPLEADEALRIIALLRHILPTATLRVCGGRPLVLGQRQKDIFAAGANALMTGDYLTTAGKAVDEDCRMIHSLGLEITA